MQAQWLLLASVRARGRDPGLASNATDVLVDLTDEALSKEGEKRINDAVRGHRQPSLSDAARWDEHLRWHYLSCAAFETPYAAELVRKYEEEIGRTVLVLRIGYCAAGVYAASTRQLPGLDCKFLRDAVTEAERIEHLAPQDRAVVQPPIVSTGLLHRGVVAGLTQLGPRVRLEPRFAASELVQLHLREHRGTIGFAEHGPVTELVEGVELVPISREPRGPYVPLTEGTVRSGAYPLALPVVLLVYPPSRSAPAVDAVLHKLLDYVLSDAAQATLRRCNMFTLDPDARSVEQMRLQGWERLNAARW